MDSRVSAIIQISVTSALFLCHTALPLLQCWPLWMQDFTAERPGREAPAGRRLSWATVALNALVLGGLVLGVFAVIDSRGIDSGLRLVSWSLALLVSVSPPHGLPTALLAIMVVITSASIAEVLSSENTWSTSSGIECGKALFALASIVVILFKPMRDSRLSTYGIATLEDHATEHLRSPEDNLRLWQFLSVSWMNPLIQFSTKHQLNEQDVWQLPYPFQTSRLRRAFRDMKGSVFTRLLRANSLDLILTTILGLLETAAKLSQPILLQRLLLSIQPEPRHGSKPMLLAGAILLVRAAQAQSSVLSSWYQRRAYERSHAEMMTAVYDKALRRSEGCVDDDNGSGSTGRVLNIVRNDCSEIAERFKELSTIVTKPLEAVVAMVLVWFILGWSAALGVAWIVVTQILSTVAIPRFTAREQRRRAETDARLQATSQFIETIRHLRWYDWQDCWAAKIMAARRRELRQTVFAGLWKLVIATISNSGASLLSTVSFFAYTYLAGETLTVELAFPALQLLTMLGMRLRDIPQLITVLANASVAMNRINSYMYSSEKEQCSQISFSDKLEFIGATFSWPGKKDPVLSHIDLSFPVGMHLICGPVGSGKSSLLLAALGELEKLSGSCTLPGAALAYCAQTPWLQEMCIRDNILFSTPYEAGRYKQVIDACALQYDFAALKHGDQTKIGEKGAGLSGGQRARIALARSIYSRARMVLLDDPLASLDSNTTHSIVQDLFQSQLLVGRTILLATHRVDLFHGVADRVIEMKDGSARVVDAYANKARLTELYTMPDMEDEMVEPAKTSTADGGDDAPEFIQQEDRASGRVAARVFWTYIKSGSLLGWLLFVLIFTCYRLSELAYFWILKAWGEAAKPEDHAALPSLPNPEVDLAPWLMWNAGIALALVLFFDLGQLSLIIITYNASKSLFTTAIGKLSKATFRYYDQTPIGRLMNRVTSDIGTLDSGIIMPLQGVAVLMISWLSSMIVIASTAPIFLVFAIGTTASFVAIFRQFFPASERLRRLQAVSLSPVMSHFGALSDGLATIRAFRLQEHFAEKSTAAIEVSQRIDHFYWSLQSWLTYRFDSLSALSHFALTGIALHYNLSSGSIAFLLATAAHFVDDTHGLCTLFGMIQMQFVSVERVVELLDLEEEPEGDVRPPAYWPRLGDDIIFDAVTVGYGTGLVPSLSNASFTIPGGSTCAVVGRTGAGKSTIALSLLATLRPRYGCITVGNVDISRVNVHTWRRRICFVAQDPVLFEGTLRENLDPLGEFTDDECEAALRRVLGFDWATLAFKVESSGKNLSQGQRQLVGIGRALLRRSPVVILDEATASIDPETMRRIQRLIAEELKLSTVIVITHHPDVIREADHVVKLANGRVIEQGPVR